MKNFYTTTKQLFPKLILRKRLFSLLLIGFISLNASAQKTAVTSGNWSNAATWSPAGVPTITDAVIINPGVNVTVDVNNAKAGSLALNLAGTGMQTSSLLFSSNGNLEVDGKVTLGQGTDRPGIIDMTNGGVLITDGFIVNNPAGSSFIPGTGTVVLKGHNPLPALFTNFSKLIIDDVTVTANNDLHISSQFKTTTITSELNMGTNKLSADASAIVDNKGTVRTQNTSSTPIPANATWGTTPEGTVIYEAPNGGQTIVTGTYNNLKVSHSNGGTSTANGPIFIEGMIDAVTPNTVINMGTYPLTATGVGGIGSQNTLGTIRTQNTSLTPIPAGRTWGGTLVYDAPGGGQKIVFGTYTNLTVNSTGTTNVSSSIVVNGNLISSPAAIINMNQDTITGSFDASGFQGTLRTQAAWAFPSGKTWGGTVRFDASGDGSSPQTIIAGQYNNLEIPLYRGMNNNLNFEADTIKIAGNFNFSALAEGTGDFIQNGTTFLFNGNNQSVSVSAERVNTSPVEKFKFKNVVINGPGTTILLDSIAVTNSLNLISGVLKTASNALLTIEDGATVSMPALGTNTSYVEGPVRKTGTTAFSFPVGQSGVFAPLTLGAPGANGDYIVQYHRPQNLGTTVTPPMVKISNCEFWEVIKNSGANNPTVTLSWNPTSNCSSGIYVTDANNVYVGKWNGLLWESAGGTGKTGDENMGTITSSNPMLLNTPGIYSIGSDQSILPVVFKNIGITVSEKGNDIYWSTASEINVDRFEVEHSENGKEFSTIHASYPKANNGQGAMYSYVHSSPAKIINYYRITAVDKDGTKTISKIVAANNKNGIETMAVYPNPVTNRKINFSLNGLDKSSYEVIVTDMMGRNVVSTTIQTNGMVFNGTIQLPASVQPGMYHIQLKGAPANYSRTIVVQ